MLVQQALRKLSHVPSPTVGIFLFFFRFDLMSVMFFIFKMEAQISYNAQKQQESYSLYSLTSLTFWNLLRR